MRQQRLPGPISSTPRALTLAETYVPIMFGASSAVGGVIETYRDITDSIRDLRRTQRVIWWLAGGAGLLCYLALSLIVRGGGVKRVA